MSPFIKILSKSHNISQKLKIRNTIIHKTSQHALKTLYQNELFLHFRSQAHVQENNHIFKFNGSSAN